MIRNVPPLVPTADVFEQHFALGEIPSLDGGRVLSLNSREGAHELATYIVRSQMEANQTHFNLRAMKDRRIPVPTNYLLMAEQQNLMIGKLWQLAGETYRSQLMAIDDLPAWIKQQKLSLSAVLMYLAGPEPSAGVQTFENWNGRGFPVIVDGPRGAVQYGPFTLPDHWVAVGEELERQALVAIQRMGGDVDATQTVAVGGQGATQPPVRGKAASGTRVYAMGVAPAVIALWVVAAAAAGGAAYGAYKLMTDPAGVLRFAARVLQTAGLTNECVGEALELPDPSQSAQAVTGCVQSAVEQAAEGFRERVGRAIALPVIFMLIGGGVMLSLLNRGGMVSPIGQSRQAPVQLHISAGPPSSLRR